MKHVTLKKFLAFFVVFLLTFTQITLMPKAAEKSDKKMLSFIFLIGVPTMQLTAVYLLINCLGTRSL
ncbi:MAG: hypothetical protein LKH68_19775 [Clostridium beijerinckii]|nr:hypothetical protein [Clostridium beijerinckii]